MSIDVMKQALEALERGETKLRYEAITALRAAIEQIHTSVSANTHQPEQEPVAFVGTNEELGWLMSDGTRRPLYTAEFTCSTGLCHYRKPLTDEQIEKLRHLIDWTAEWSYNTFARAIEAVHGIGGNDGVALFAAKHPRPESSPAIDEYNAINEECGEPPSPLERLRFFCSLAMKPQDWLDVEPFFIELEQQLESCGSWDEHRVIHDPTTDKVMSELRTTVEQAPVQVSPHEFVAMVQGKEHLIGKPVAWAQWPTAENT